MYRDIPTALLHVVEPIVREHGLELVDASVSGEGSRCRVQVVLDTPQGDGRVNIDTCAAVSRELGHTLDVEEDIVPERYTLEVTSPGVDRVLGREVDFERVVGQRVQVETRAAVDGRRRFKGELLRFDGATAHLRVGPDDVALPFESIARAHAFYPQPVGGRVARPTPKRSKRHQPPRKAKR